MKKKKLDKFIKKNLLLAGSVFSVMSGIILSIINAFGLIEFNIFSLLLLLITIIFTILGAVGISIYLDYDEFFGDEE